MLSFLDTLDEQLPLMEASLQKQAAIRKWLPGQEHGGVSNGTSLPFCYTECHGFSGETPSCYLSDSVWLYAAGVFDIPEGQSLLSYFLLRQGPDKMSWLRTGAVVPPYTIPHRLLPQGEVICFPFTEQFGADQGGGALGNRPVLTNAFELIWLASMLRNDSTGAEFLVREVAGKSVIKRLEEAFLNVDHDEHTGLVTTEEGTRACPGRLYEGVSMTGALLYPSLMRWRAARHLSELHKAIGDSTRGLSYGALSHSIRQSISEVFVQPALERAGKGKSPWLDASTEQCRQPDIWSTFYLLAARVFPPDELEVLSQSVVKELQNSVKGAPFKLSPDEWKFLKSQSLEGISALEWDFVSGGGETWKKPVSGWAAWGWMIRAVDLVDQGLSEAAFIHLADHLKNVPVPEKGEKVGPMDVQLALALSCVKRSRF